MRKFEGFMRQGFAKKQTPNKERAKSLAEESKDKYRFLQATLKSVPKDQMSPNFIVESCYDILIQLIRAKMFIDGFNSNNSHEAEISYMERIKFSEAEIRFMDEFRYNRNGIKYYGKRFELEYAEKILKFMKQIQPRLKQLLSK